MICQSPTATQSLSLKALHQTPDPKAHLWPHPCALSCMMVDKAYTILVTINPAPQQWGRCFEALFRDLSPSKSPGACFTGCGLWRTSQTRTTIFFGTHFWQIGSQKSTKTHTHTHIYIYAFPAKGKVQTTACKGCQTPTPCWTRQIQARPSRPWAQCSVFVPHPATRGHKYIYIHGMYWDSTVWRTRSISCRYISDCIQPMPLT